MINISLSSGPLSRDVPIGEHRADSDRAAERDDRADGVGEADDRAGRIAASRRWQRSPIGNPTLLRGSYWVVVIRHEPGRYGFAIDRVWARGCWASEGEAKRAAVMALLGLPRKPRHRPARADRAGLTGWRAARVESGGRDVDAVYDVYDDGDAAEQSEERNFA